MRHRVEIIFPTSAGFLGELLLSPKFPDNIGKIRLPGGGVEEGEHPIEAACREMFEEYSIMITPQDLSLYTVVDNDRGRATRVIFRGETDDLVGRETTEEGQKHLGRLVVVEQLPAPWL